MKLAWSNRAIGELRELRLSSVERWGHMVAKRYLEDLQNAAKQLSGDPSRARPLKGPFRILRIRSHDLIVHVVAVANHLAIARVLHVAMDIERHLG